MSPAAQVEALLFQLAEPVSLTRLGKLLGWPQNEVEKGLNELENNLTNRGLALVRNGDEVTLGTAPETAELLTKIAKDELDGAVGKAGLETLTIILYHAPISRPEIDYIRGVNSSFIIRHLLIRGLIKRAFKAGNNRVYVYEPTTELLAHLGLKNRESLPRYQEIIKLTSEALNSKDEQI